MNRLVRTAVLQDAAAIRHYDIHIAPQTLLDCIGQGRVYVLEVEGVVAGTMRFSLFWNEYPFLDHILLDFRCRGCGCGTEMIRSWAEKMCDQGYRYLLTSTQENESAWHFYEKLGFKRIGGFYPPEQNMLELIYQKKL